jgi:peptidoglycan/LPS O-acetylase OafA/YrhL
MEGKLLSALSGSVLRRYGRLYASAGIAMFISMLCAWFNLGVDHPVTKRPSLWLQLRHFADDFGRFSNPFVPIEGFWHADVFKPEYLLVLWTIPIEFRGSLVVFLVLVGCAGMVSRARMGSAVVLMGACYYWLTTFAALFLGGMVLADVGFERFPQRLGGGAGAGPGAARTNANPNPNPRDEPTLPHSSRDPDPEKKPLFQDEGETYSIRQKVLYATLLLTSLLLLSQPTTPLLESHWPWPYLDRLIPTSFATSPQKEHFFLSIGSLLLVFVLDSFPPFQKPLNWPLMQYFGEVSFGVYTMHLLVLWCFWRPVLEPIKLRWLGEGMAANLPFWVVFWVAILWAGEGFCVLDKLVVKGGRWMQNWLFDV